MIQNGIFISGTDTGVGKTIVSSLILASLRSQGISAGYFKPVQTGSDWDTPTVAKLCEAPSSELHSPTYCFSEPAAPYRAALGEGKQIELEKILADWERIRSDRFWVVEGAGGLLVPLTQTQTIRDLILQMQLKLVLVASTRLGTINHTALSVEAARHAGIDVLGIVLVGIQDQGLEQILEEMTQTSIIAQVPVLSSLTPQTIQTVSREYFPPRVLAKLKESS